MATRRAKSPREVLIQQGKELVQAGEKVLKLAERTKAEAPPKKAPAKRATKRKSTAKKKTTRVRKSG